MLKQVVLIAKTVLISSGLKVYKISYKFSENISASFKNTVDKNSIDFKQILHMRFIVHDCYTLSE